MITIDSDTVPIPYDVTDKQTRADGTVVVTYGTLYPDQYFGHIQNACLYNGLILKRLSAEHRPSWMTSRFLSKNMIEPFVKYFRLLLTNGSASNGQQTVSLFCAVFGQVGQFYWLATRDRQRRDNADLLYAKFSATDRESAGTGNGTLPAKPISKFTQMDCISCLCQLCYLIRHVPAGQALDGICYGVMTRACHLLMGYGPVALVDGEAGGFAEPVPDRPGFYTASIRYVRHVGVRFAIIMSYLKYRGMRSRPMSATELQLIDDNHIVDRIREFVKVASVAEKDVVETMKIKKIRDGCISLGDGIISNMENPGQCMSAGEDAVIANVHPKTANVIKIRRDGFCKLSNADIVRGAAGIDMSELLVIWLFFSRVNANDTPRDPYTAFVIEYQMLQTAAASAKMVGRPQPFIVQLDCSRFCVVEDCCRIVSDDIYNTLALWLVRVLLKFGGIPEPTMGCLDNTYKEFCSKYSQLQLKRRGLTL
jgi:hypothetical protein